MHTSINYDVTGKTVADLQGRRIGYLPSSFASTQISDEAIEVVGAAGPDRCGHLRGRKGCPGGGRRGTGRNRCAPGTARRARTDHRQLRRARLDRLHQLRATFPMRTPAEVWKNLANLPYSVSGTSVDSRVPSDDQSVENYLARRDSYKEAVGAWMAEAEVDAVAYPCFISQLGNNDATSAVLSSDPATGVLTSNVDLPTVVVPIGETSLGYSNSLQLVGPAWTDAEVLAMGYPVEQQADARVRTTHAPTLDYTGPAGSLLTLELDAASVEHGTPAHATVTVTSSRKVTGEVTVEVDGKLRTASLNDGSATLTLPADLAAGRHVVVARFEGNSKVAASEAATQLQITASDQVVTLRGAAKVAAGEPAKLAVTARSGSAPVTEGTVLLLRGATVVSQGLRHRDGYGVGEGHRTGCWQAPADGHGHPFARPRRRHEHAPPAARGEGHAEDQCRARHEAGDGSDHGAVERHRQGPGQGAGFRARHRQGEEGQGELPVAAGERGLRKVTVVYMGNDKLRKVKVTIKR